MKAKLEKEPFNIKGVQLTSENDTEKLMLERLWTHHGRPAELIRSQTDGSVSMVITPAADEREEYHGRTVIIRDSDGSVELFITPEPTKKK